MDVKIWCSLPDRKIFEQHAKECQASTSLNVLVKHDPCAVQVRHRLKGVQAEVLDYADLIVSSSVESAVLKPVALAGTATLLALHRVKSASKTKMCRLYQ